MARRLEGVRVALLVADGFEQIEAAWPRQALRRAGADVRVLSLRPGSVRGMNFTERGSRLGVDQTVGSARAQDFSALLLVGGFVNPDLLRQSSDVRTFVREMDRLGRPIAAVCHGPQVLISAGLVSGRKLAAWPGIADDLRNAGATWVDEPVVHDGRWVTSRGPQDIAAFSAAAIDLFEASAPRDLAPLRRRLRAASAASRLGTYASVAALAIGARELWAARGRQRRVRRAKVATFTGLPAIAIGAAGYVAWRLWQGSRAIAARPVTPPPVPLETIPAAHEPAATTLRETGRSYAPGAVGVTVGAGTENRVDLPSRSR